MLSVEIRRKSFGGQVVIEGLALTLAPDEIVALVGPSGCGKTTLLKMIGGLDRQFDGEIRWAAGRAPRIGTVFQEPRLLPWRTVWENLALVLPPGAGMDGAATLLDELDLAPYRDRYAAKLSLGMARRLALARAFVVQPALLLLDEPFVSLDEAMAARSRDLLIRLWRARPTAALLVTHDLVEGAALADRILTLSAGPARVAREFVVPQALRRRGAEAAMEVAAALRQTAK